MVSVLSMLTARPGLVVLMCGVAGSGKTTFSKALEARGFRRISIDEVIWQRYGRFGVDYAPEDYAANVSAARQEVQNLMQQAVRERAAVVVDSSFWSRRDRDDAKRLVEREAGEWRLVYLKSDEASLRSRLKLRAARFDANAAFPISDAMLGKFLSGFEAPQGEGELVVDTGADPIS